MADHEYRQRVYVENMDHEELRQVVGILLDRLGLEVEKLTEINHGYGRQERFYLREPAPSPRVEKKEE